MHFLHIANSDKPVPYYSLDVVISVGYRVKSPNGVIFRKWANAVLKEYLIKKCGGNLEGRVVTCIILLRIPQNGLTRLMPNISLFFVFR